jgi:NADH:ubiquinone oxidoreductase subunit K
VSDKVTIEEQIESGLIRPRQTFVPALRGEVLPPVRPIPNAPMIVDPYAQHLPQIVQQVVKSESNPISRARAMLIKTSAITVFMAILTGASMIALQWYPHDAHGFVIFMIWIGVASLEWIVSFWMLARLDYREQPAAQAWYEMKAFVRMMSLEQDHRLRALYPDQYDQNGRRKW